MSVSRSCYQLSSFLIRSICKNPNYLNTYQNRTLIHVNLPRNLLNSSRKFYSSQNSSLPIASFEEVQQVPSKKNVFLIDVREPNELKETGIIPGSINIPLGDVENVLKNTPPQEFQKKFGRNKPVENSEIIFHCMIGKRSEVAQDIAHRLGYKNVKNYLGSWIEWAEKIKS